MPLILKMAASSVKRQSVLNLANTETVPAVQRVFRKQFHTEPPRRVPVYAKIFELKRCNFKAKSPGSPSVSDATVDRVRY
jgi:hypothetical protein